MTIPPRRIPSLAWIAFLLVAFVAGAVIAAPHHATHASPPPQQFNNQVLEVSAAGAGLRVRDAPNPDAGVIGALYWGDRVLWTGNSAMDGTQRWLKITMRDGQTGWISDINGWTTVTSPVYTTPGIGIGALVSITTQGDGAHCRAIPSASSSESQTMNMGDPATVIGGPYQAEYWIWWQYRLNSGQECWIVDVPGWITVVSPGTF